MPSLSTKIRPPWASTSTLTIDKPSPVECSPPVGCALKRVKRWNNCFLSSSVSPGPSSRTSIITWSANVFMLTYIWVFAGEYLMALLIRLSTTSFNFPSSPVTITSISELKSMTCPFLSAKGWFIATTLLTR
ncbi:hypothetical protein D3C87_1710530 [compost metagenome]